ncbi:DUF2752 domain-containing protein [Pyxidicoccus xibeiensis]|uniref:DUF2752 domain-containing protein n=1 Tax=Pyxidicoccus xibeiensis TaxID=2906759 RepID=UPI0020A77926|nr:DUF2752 domain-containing protein [Pyxidicoccus xibeiensis]MCP3138646.1 DUF2752 domain-containing protein [Pyxidicoccus xibeiensis]
MFSTPVLAQLLERRTTGQVLGAVAAIHLGLMHFGLPTWPCPVQSAVGLPCPGCGLSRATAALLHGDWRAALSWHAFAPVILAALALIIGMAFLPEAARRRGIDAVARVERRTRVTALLLVALVAYWLIRLLVFRDTFLTSTLS